jgi:preprotein translocase subunit SecD
MRPLSVGLIAFALLCLSLAACAAKPKWEEYEGGIHVVLKAESKGDRATDIANTTKISEMIGARLKELGVKNKIIRTREDREIVVQLPPFKNPDLVVRLISYSPVLAFKLVDEENHSEGTDKSLRPGEEILTMKTWDTGTGKLITKPIVVKQQPLLSGDVVSDVRVRTTRSSGGGEEVYVALEFNSEGARRFDKATAENIGRRLAIAVDDTVYSAPVIRERIASGKASITGGFTADEAQNLAIVLRAGSFPAPVKVIEYKTLDRRAWLGGT